MSTSDPKLPATLDYSGADTYRDRPPGWQRKFVLSGDCLIIHAKKFMGIESEVPIALARVDPNYARRWRRNETALTAPLLMSVLLFAGMVMMWSDRTVPRLAFVGMAAFGIICVVFALFHIRRFELVSFGHNYGPHFDISCTGPDRERFDEFVARVVTRITELRQQQPTSASQALDAGLPIEPRSEATESAPAVDAQ